MNPLPFVGSRDIRKAVTEDGWVGMIDVCRFPEKPRVEQRTIRVELRGHQVERSAVDGRRNRGVFYRERNPRWSTVAIESALSSGSVVVVGVAVVAIVA